MGELVNSDKRIIITGASGWMGMATLDLLHRILRNDFARRVVCFGSNARVLTLADGIQIAQRPLGEMDRLDAQPSWLLHYAFLTKDRAEQMAEAEYCRANQTISDTVLAAINMIGVEAVFLASSGAAARASDSSASPAMRLYGAMKLADEAAFADWAAIHSKRAVIARVFSITGPYINKHGAYAIASFIHDALAGRVIAVRAPRAVVRAYVAVDELIALIVALLGEESSGVVRFDSGGEPLELGAVAQCVDQAIGGAGVDRAAMSDHDTDCYHGDGQAYARLLAQHGIAAVPLRAQVINTAAYLKVQTAIPQAMPLASRKQPC